MKKVNKTKKQEIPQENHEVKTEFLSHIERKEIKLSRNGFHIRLIIEINHQTKEIKSSLFNPLKNSNEFVFHYSNPSVMHSAGKLFLKASEYVVLEQLKLNAGKGVK